MTIQSHSKISLGQFASVFLAVAFGGFAFAAGVARSGTEIGYVCSAGPNKTRLTQVYGERGDSSSLLTRFGADLAVDGDAELWQYITGLYGRAAEGSVLKVLTLKSGNLKSANAVKAATSYQGVITYSDRMTAYDLEISVVVGKAVSERTALGMQSLLPVTTTIKNADGKGGTAVVQVKFSPSLRVNFEEKYSGAFPDRNWNCVASSLKLNKQIETDNVVQFDFPVPGSVLTYQCEGKVKSRTLKVSGNTNGTVKYSVTRDSTSTSDFLGDSWNLYAGLAREIATPGKQKLMMDFKGDEVAQLRQTKLKLGGYYGRVVMSGLDTGDHGIRVGVHPKFDYISKEYGTLRVVPINSVRAAPKGTLVRTEYLYSDKLKAPVWYRIREKTDPTRNQECRLVSHSAIAPSKK